MLLRNSITNTKKFFQKTIENVKSFLSVGNTYEKLPKTPPFHPFSCGRDTKHINGDDNNKFNNELDNFYTEFTHQWDSRKGKLKNKPQKKKLRESTKKTQNFFLDDSSQKENCNVFTAGIEENKNNNGGFMEKINEKEEILKGKRLNLSPGINLQNNDLCSPSVREKRLGLVVEKLKEIEVIDKGNVDHKLDFEEFLHCYSRLTCPVYLDIVDKFLTEMCREFLGAQASPKVNYSRPVLQALKV